MVRVARGPGQEQQQRALLPPQVLLFGRQRGFGYLLLLLAAAEVSRSLLLLLLELLKMMMMMSTLRRARLFLRFVFFNPRVFEGRVSGFDVQMFRHDNAETPVFSRSPQSPLPRVTLFRP